MTLAEKLQNHDAKVCIIGLGYVGLPLGLMFAEVGFGVVGIDINQQRVKDINSGGGSIGDTTVDELRHARPGGGATGQLVAKSTYDDIGDADAIVICVPTPLSKTHEPDVSFVVAAAEEVAKRLHPGMLVVLESTTYPGTTEDLLLPALVGDKSSGLEVGKDFFLAFSPERIDPGQNTWTLTNTPKVIGGVTPKCLEIASLLYTQAVETLIPVSTPATAEMTKLLENTFRAVNVGMVNEMAIMCEKLGVNVWEVIEAAKSKPFGFMPFYPGPGLGGHCIPIDPQYLAWKLRTVNYTARFIELAEEINFGMPSYVVGRLSDALNDEGKPIRGSNVLVIGVAYKADVEDTRESPALDVIELLNEKGARITYHDPLVPVVDVLDTEYRSVDISAESLQKYDCVVIVTPHSTIDWDMIVGNSRLILDTRNALAAVEIAGAKIVRL